MSRALVAPCQVGRCWAVLLVCFVLSSAGCSKTEVGGDTLAAPESVVLRGSGASFPAPLYRRWAADFSRQQAGVVVEFESKGSGAGIREFIDGATDFGASDAAMTDEHLIAQGNRALMLPVTAGAIVLAYNLPGVGSLRLPRMVYTAMFLGRIQHWDDPAIAEANPGVELPSLPIRIVHRSDPSGTTWVFLNHFDKVSPWSERLGVDLDADWPVGTGADGNAGVASAVRKTPGAIGYVQLMSARKEQLAVATLENREGVFVEPTLEASRRTLLAVGLPADMRAWLPDPIGADSYPIVTYTWLLVNKTYNKPKADGLKAFLRHALTTGQELSEGMSYVRLPPEVAARVAAAVDEIGVETGE